MCNELNVQCRAVFPQPTLNLEYRTEHTLAHESITTSLQMDIFHFPRHALFSIVRMNYNLFNPFPLRFLTGSNYLLL